MPNVNRDQTVYIPTGNPDNWAEQTLTRPGELGKVYDWNDRTYQRVKLDSGATDSNTVGYPAANQLAFWKDRANYLVTNDSRLAEGGSKGTNAWANSVAGIFRATASATGTLRPGYYCDILVRGRNIAVADDGNGAVGELLRADISSTTVNRTNCEAVGTAPVYQNFGRVRTASAANVIYADVDFLTIP